MENTPDSEAALIEAWEEAGVKRIKSDPMHCGSLRYNKVMKDGTDQPIEMQLFSFETAKLSKNFPERGQRKLALGGRKHRNSQTETARAKTDLKAT